MIIYAYNYILFIESVTYLKSNISFIIFVFNLSFVDDF